MATSAGIAPEISLHLHHDRTAPIFNRIAQKLQISRKYGNENLYSHHMGAPEVGWVYVRDIGNNLTYQGWAHEISENEYMQELVLRKVSVFRYEDSEFLYDVPSIYLSRKPGELIIEMIPIDKMEKVDGYQEIRG